MICAPYGPSSTRSRSSRAMASRSSRRPPTRFDADRRPAPEPVARPGALATRRRPAALRGHAPGRRGRHRPPGGRRPRRRAGGLGGPGPRFRPGAGRHAPRGRRDRRSQSSHLRGSRPRSRRRARRAAGGCPARDRGGPHRGRRRAGSHGGQQHGLRRLLRGPERLPAAGRQQRADAERPGDVPLGRDPARRGRSHGPRCHGVAREDTRRSCPRCPSTPTSRRAGGGSTRTTTCGTWGSRIGSPSPRPRPRSCGPRSATRPSTASSRWIRTC